MSTEPWRPKYNPWLIAVVVSLAAFMEVLDTSIANVALPYMAGGLGASNDESTWVLTSYLAANAIVLPISGWLVGVFGRKRFFMTCILVFTVSSLLCGMAPSLGLLLVARVLQGAGGGGLQPMAQAILADAFPPEKRGLAFGLYGLTAVMAPTIGPTLGGWITDNYSWHWIFLINVPVGLLALGLVLHLLEDPPYLTGAHAGGMRLDYIGFALLALGVGALQVVLDKGQEDDWFGSRFITTLAVVAGASLISLVVWELLHDQPLIDLRLFKNTNFLSANAMMLMLGIVLFSSLVMIPQFLQSLMGYDALNAGLALSAGGLVLLVGMPIAGKLTSRVQARFLIATGWAGIALSMVYSAQHLDLLISFGSAAWLRVVQSVSLPLLFVPINLAAYVGLPPEKGNSAAGLINFMRNIGSSIGTSMVTTLIARRSQFHQVHLVSRMATDNPVFQAQVGALTKQLVDGGLGTYQAKRQAYARLYLMVRNQASTLAYVDTFWFLALCAAVMFGLSFL
ncbi:MAG: DHA2 family efflux MFS transporter permease subunit, partial [Actinomycetota bacterium]|nr:DHA2 family efflux MFS transporter permease subunit [Actinomycetota bacterium]